MELDGIRKQVNVNQNKLSKSGQFEKQGDLPAKIQVPPNVAPKHHLVPS